jgi:glutamate racemase
VHLVITDSGLGGLTVFAQLERALRAAGRSRSTRLTYVNAWPEQGRGYNSLPDLSSRARVFDLALERMRDMRPDAIVIACNTLSIVYEQTVFRRSASVPVHGIVDAGVNLFAEALAAEPDSALVVLGTRTTVESGAHRERLAHRGFATARIAGVSCHGLATAIEQGPDRADVRGLVEACARAAADAAPVGEPLFAGLCCTHYSLVEDGLRAALAASSARTIGTLDPNTRLVEELTARFAAPAAPGQSAGPEEPVSVEVISKVHLSDAQRAAIGGIVEPISPAAARAIARYRHVPDLF